MRVLKAAVFPVAALGYIGWGLGLSFVAAAQAVSWDVDRVLSRVSDRLEGRR